MNEPALHPESGFIRFRMDFSYDGSFFAGWAKQLDQRTIQEESEAALQAITRFPVRTQVAGRTDAGVHATAQVAHFDLPDVDTHSNPWDEQDLLYKMNRMLADDIRIHSIIRAPKYFHARFSALSREYFYKIADANQVIPPLKRYDIVSWYRPIDIELVKRAIKPLLGQHDFAAFCKKGSKGTSIRTLEQFKIYREPNNFISIHVIADAFCYSMVRNLVGAAVCVGEGRYEPEWMKELLDQKERVGESLVFPGAGLTLIKVNYPEDSMLQERMEQTLRRRDQIDFD